MATLIAIAHVAGAVVALGVLGLVLGWVESWIVSRLHRRTFEELAIKLRITTDVLDDENHSLEVFQALADRSSNELFRNRLSDALAAIRTVWFLFSWLLQVAVLVGAGWYAATRNPDFATYSWAALVIAFVFWVIGVVFAMICHFLTGRYPGEAKQLRKMLAQSLRGQQVADTSSEVFEPDALATALIYAFMEWHFGIDKARMNALSAKLPEDIREYGVLWINLYLCWVYRLKIQTRFGEAAFEQVFAAVRVRFSAAMAQKGYDLTLYFADVLDQYFKILDRSFKAKFPISADQQANGVDLPSIELTSAWALIATSLESTSMPDVIREQVNLYGEQVAEMLLEAKSVALPVIDRIVAAGGNVRP